MGRHKAGKRVATSRRRPAPRRRAVVRRVPRSLLAAGSAVATALVVAVGIGVVPPQATPVVTAATGGGAEAPGVVTPRTTSGGATGSRAVAPAVRIVADKTSLPANSGTGRRVVFSQRVQRVWLVEADGTVGRTYPVSGSIYDNLQPGSYAVFSRSEQAWGIDNSGTMRNFVRFAHGPNAAIGFHDIPELDGRPVQTERQLGTPLSHGCVRQASADALALWEFAPLGTRVVVV